MSIKLVSERPLSLDWTAILPCPFCSSAASVVTCHVSGSKEKAISSVVICNNCNAAGPLVGDDFDYHDPVKLEKLAIKKWNRRGNLSGAEHKLRRIAAILNMNEVN